MSKKIHFACLIFLYTTFLYGQELSGYVTDTLNAPLPNANVIAFPQGDKGSLTYSVSDEKGRYRLVLQKNTIYEIKVSYMGFVPQVFVYEPEKKITSYNFALTPSNELLEGVVVTYQEPIVFKKDTTTYRVEMFATGKERKLHEQLEKLPNVEVDSYGNVSFKGKNVSTLLIENKTFFGGGTQLGVKNIPADAVEKIQFIENYTKVDFLKEVTDSKDIALNIQLKEDKKKFIFGDLQAGYGNKKSHLLHSALFLYSPELSLSYLGDVNNFGKSTFSQEEATRFQGGVSSFIDKSHRTNNLSSFTNDNREVTQSESLLNAINLNLKLNEKTDVSGYVIFHKNDEKVFRKNRYHYLQSDIFEERQHKKQSENNLALFNFEFEFLPKVGTKWIYSVFSNISNSTTETNIFSDYQNHNQQVKGHQMPSDVILKQYVEKHQSHHAKLKTTLVINHSLEKKDLKNQWISNEPIFLGIIPLLDESSYDISKFTVVENHQLNWLYKQYRTINNRNHIYISVGDNIEKSNLKTVHYQLIDNKKTHYFSDGKLSGETDYLLNDAFMNFEYKFRIGKWTNRIVNSFHFYYLIHQQFDKETNMNRFLYEPSFFSEYELSTSESIEGSYSYGNEFPKVNELSEFYSLQEFNTLSKGNRLLRNEKHHILNLSYIKSNMYRNYFLGLMFNFTQKSNPISYEITSENVNQIYSVVQLDNPERFWNTNIWLNKKMQNFRFLFSSYVSGFYYNRVTNAERDIITHHKQQVSFGLKSYLSKKYEFTIRYSHQFNQMKTIVKDNFQNQRVFVQSKIVPIKNVTFESIYRWDNLIKEKSKNYSDEWNVSMLYQKEGSPLSLELKAYNLLNAKKSYQKTNSDYLISEQEIYLMYRTVLFSVSYKL